jgi:hypothetical protein
LARHPDTLSSLTNAPFQDVSSPEFSSDSLDIDRLAFVNKAGVPSDNIQRSKPRQFGENVFHYSVGEILLLRITAHILEW